ncbi:Phosphotyrosine protein phosphatase I superfamily [Trinorchestia longiramus]|nr:Phosphotyrosine protein phosphatase I superfamily [Trinorchestia longiramus]
MGKEWKVLFVCLGNICRSPTAEAVFQQEATLAGLNVYVDSAGIIDYHRGKQPDSRARQTMAKHGVPMDHRARQITKEDFSKFDYIFGKDEENMDDLKRLQPAGSTAVVELFGKYHKQKNLIIRDPYYDDGSEGFEECYQQCLVCSKGFIEHLKSLDG